MYSKETERLEELAIVYRESTPMILEMVEHLNQISGGYSHHKVRQILYRCHALKGATRFVGLLFLSEPIQLLEEVFISIEKSRCPMGLIHQKRVVSILDWIQETLAQVVKNPAYQPSSESIREILQRLQVLVDELNDGAHSPDGIASSQNSENHRGEDCSPIKTSDDEDSTERLIAVRSMVVLAYGFMERLQRATWHKQVKLFVQCDDLGLPSSLHWVLQQLLPQLLGNAFIHGIEETEERLKRRKPSHGHVALTLLAREEGIEIGCHDDGRGFVMEPFAPYVSVKGLHDVPVRQHLSSTASTTGYDAGRGLGLKMLCETVEARGGHLNYTTCPQQGTQVKIHLPCDFRWENPMESIDITYNRLTVE